MRAATTRTDVPALTAMMRQEADDGAAHLRARRDMEAS
jgi:hypothetical protein